jgi:hypothetical protein
MCHCTLGTTVNSLTLACKLVHVIDSKHMLLYNMLQFGQHIHKHYMPKRVGL